MKDRSVEGHVISIGGRIFARGLGTHSPGAFLVDLDRGCHRFAAWVGIDDETSNRGSVEFQVVGDGKLLWSSGIVRGGELPKRVDLDLSNIRQVALLVGDGGDGFEFDHADWADAEFEVVGEIPRAAKRSASNPSIASPREPEKPVITSPTVFGVRTGTPTLYAITAVGAGHITYSAFGLPQPLTLDRETGRITGELPHTGLAPQPGMPAVQSTPSHTYHVTIKATSEFGTDSKPLTITSGDRIAPTPPLGWNSYDCFGDDVTESEILTNARYVQEHLHRHGWEYIVVDYRWYDPNAARAPNNANAHNGEGLSLDRFGRLQPAPNRFPSAEAGAGFKPLAHQIHAMGLKFGIHIMRGITRQAVKENLPIEGSDLHAADAVRPGSVCSWCNDMYGVDASKPAGVAWYDSLVRMYAAWGVDYIKVDDMSAPYSTLEIEAMHNAIEKCGRSIVLSLSPGDTPVENGKHVATYANLWRISGDFWDNWGAVSHQFELIDRWRGFGGPGHWPDADMIPLGHLSVNGRSVGPDRRTDLTKDEQVTMISLWSLAPSPMMLGMNLPDNDPWTVSLITNDEVLAVNQDQLGSQAIRMPRGSRLSGTEVWSRDMADGSKVVGLFNRIGAPITMRISWGELGIKRVKHIRDLWLRKDIVAEDSGYETTLGAHGAVLLRVTPDV